MGNMIKCPQGHYYDQAQSSRCPFCGVASIDLDATVKARDQTDFTTVAASTLSQSRGSNDGNTVAYDVSGRPGAGANSDPEVTRAVWSQQLGIDPVVGWLVCTKGANRGRDYRIRSGWNSIGRDPSMQICIAGDETISREDHARIFFDPKATVFHITSGSGRSGVYVNGVAVLQPTTLKRLDSVEVGSTTCVFMPFCGPEFSWKGEE